MEFIPRFFGDEERAAAAEMLRDRPQLPSLTINIKDPPYNAAGDGVTDDTAAFDEAMKAVGPGSTIYVPPGVYLIGGPDTSVVAEWKSCLTVMGAGPCSVLRRRPGGDLPIFDRGGGILKFVGGSHITVRDIAFDANGYTGLQLPQEEWHQGEVLQFSSSEWVFVSRCRFFDTNPTNAGRFGRRPPAQRKVALLFDRIQSTMPCKMIRVEDNEFAGLGMVVRSVSGCSVVRNRFESTASTALEFSDYDLNAVPSSDERFTFEDISISDNFIRNAAFDGIAVVARHNATRRPRRFRRIVVDRNTILDTAPSGEVEFRAGIRVGFDPLGMSLIVVPDFEDGLAFSDIRIASNHIDAQSNDEDFRQGMGGGIAVMLPLSLERELTQDSIAAWPHFRFVEVTGNLVRGRTAVGIHGSGLTASRIGCNSVFGISHGGSAIKLESVNDVLVDNNRVNHDGHRPVHLLSLTRSYGKNALRLNVEMGKTTARGGWFTDDVNRHDRFFDGDDAIEE